MSNPRILQTIKTKMDILFSLQNNRWNSPSSLRPFRIKRNRRIHMGIFCIFKFELIFRKKFDPGSYDVYIRELNAFEGFWIYLFFWRINLIEFKRGPRNSCSSAKSRFIKINTSYFVYE